MGFRYYDSCHVKNGVVHIGDKVRIPGEWSVPTDAGTMETRTDVEGTVGAIYRDHPIRANHTRVEILDEEGIYLTTVYQATILERLEG